MSSAQNGHADARGAHTRRLRFDDLASLAHGTKSGAAVTQFGGGHSGRRLVLMAVCTLLLIWGTLYLIFRDWRTRYRARASYGATQVVPAIEPLAAMMPQGVDPLKWRDAVEQTRAMLLTVVASNLLDVRDMDRLRTDLDRHVASARDHPETALRELAEIWNEMAERSDFLLKNSRPDGGDRHPRPAILPPRAKVSQHEPPSNTTP
jgi:hypothetical protein